METLLNLNNEVVLEKAISPRSMEVCVLHESQCSLLQEGHETRVSQQKWVWMIETSIKCDRETHINI